MAIVIGINAQHSNASACVVINGVVQFAIEEERIIRIKNYNGFPYQSLKACFEFIKKKNGNYNYDCLALNNDPKSNILAKINKLYLLGNKYYFSSIKLYIKKFFLKEFDRYNIPKKKIIRVNHHLSHLSSAFFNAGFKNAIGLTIDGFGDGMSMGIYLCDVNKIKLIHKINYPHSLGIFYQSMTQYLNFKEYGDEYKVMGLAGYGKKYLKEVDSLLKFEKKYNFKLNLNFFNYKNFGINTASNGTPCFVDFFNKKKINNLFKDEKNKNSIFLKQNIAHSIQEKFSEIILQIIFNLKKDFKNYNNLCLAGGCFFNSDLLGRIEKNKIFKNVFTYPNPGDAGGAVGAALYVSKKFYGIHHKKKIENLVYLGPSYTNCQIEKDYLEFKKRNNISIKMKHISQFNKLCDFTATQISKGKIVAWFQDRMEWGQRALGNRSILADPRKKKIIKVLNEKIKEREKFRPFAGSILKEHAKDYFKLEKDSPYMLAVYEVNPEKKNKILGIVHKNNTCRIQTVSKKNNQKFYDLINAFNKITNIPILLNTSFNIREPIVCSPYNALNTFFKSNIDYLVINNYVFNKK